MFKPYLSLDDIYVSPLKKTENGLYTVMSNEEVLASFHPNTESRLMNQLAMTLVTLKQFRPYVVAETLGVDVRDLSGSVRILFGITLKQLLQDYQHRLLFELVQKTSLSTTEVAKRAGFASTKSMHNHFNMNENTTFMQLRYDSQRMYVSKKVTYEVVG